jgi:hypothetical protein
LGLPVQKRQNQPRQLERKPAEKKDVALTQTFIWIPLIDFMMLSFSCIFLDRNSCRFFAPEPSFKERNHHPGRTGMARVASRTERPGG